MLDKQGYTHARACTRLRSWSPAKNIYCFFTGTMIRERASVLRYSALSVMLFLCVSFPILFVETTHTAVEFSLFLYEVGVCQVFIVHECLELMVAITSRSMERENEK